MAGGLVRGVLLEGSGHNQSGCHRKVIIPTPLNILGGMGVLDPKARADVVELYAGSPSAAAADGPSEGPSVDPLD